VFIYLSFISYRSVLRFVLIRALTTLDWTWLGLASIIAFALRSCALATPTPHSGFDDTFAFVERVQTDRMARVLAVPTFCMIGFYYLVIYLRFSLGDTGAAKETPVLNKGERQFFAMLFSFGLADMNGSVGFGTFVLASIYASAWIRGKLAGCLLLKDKMSAKKHQNLFFGGLVILVGMVYGMIVAYRTLDIVWMYHIVGSVMISGLSIILDIIGHVVFLLDPNEFEMSVGSYRVFRIAESVVNVLELSVSLFFIGCLLIESELPILHIRQLIDNLNDIYNQYRQFHRWMKTRHMVGHLPKGIEPDMMREDICVICRLEMGIGSGRKLPCSHCFHPACIERWICQQVRCPICRRDLKPLLDEVERMLNGETDRMSVSVEDRKIIGFADLLQ
jgi:hypothetical protein